MFEPFPDHVYLHVPFCRAKCAYCGFYSVAGDAGLQRRFAACAAREALRACGGETVAPRTLYFGGGTPGVLATEGLGLLWQGLAQSIAPDRLEEWTCELTPETAAEDTLRTLRRMGVTRTSMGVQSFNAGVARRLGRTPVDVAACMRRIRRAGFDNAGVDLIAGLPGVDGGQWLDDVAHALALEPDHVSVYALSVEPGSRLAQWVAEGRAAVPDDGAVMDRIDAAETLLARAGFNRYEISNHARPGKECRHHLGVWRGEDFAGFGPAAFSRAGNKRWKNTADVEGYVARVEAGGGPEREREKLDPLSDACERAFTALRLSEGWDATACAARFPALAPYCAAAAEKLAALETPGLVAQPVAGRWVLTRRGREVADGVVRELLKCVVRG